MGERVHKSVMNIKVGMLFYVLSLFLAFFSRKIFLDCLGAEFIGLTGMLMNIMSFLKHCLFPLQATSGRQSRKNQ